MAGEPRRVKFDRKVLIAGFSLIALAIAGTITWLAIAGPAPQPVTVSVTVPVETIAKTDPSQTAENTLPPPAKVPTGLAAAVPFDATDKRPRIAILVTDLGPSVPAAEAMIRHLPKEVSLAFLTFSQDTPDLVAEARAAGHEVLLDVPMEPATYPDDDPGSSALMTNASDNENMRRLEQGLGRTQGYVGIVNFMGSRFTSSQEKLAPVFSALHTHDLLVVDTRANTLTAVPAMAQELKIPYAVADLTIDSEASREAIDRNLAQLEQIARTKGKALGIAGAYPVSADRIAEWSKSLATKGLVLAPISAIVTSPKT